MWNRNTPALKNRCLCHFRGLGLEEESPEHICIKTPGTFAPDCTAATGKTLGSQAGDHREKEGVRHCCWEELVLCLSPARFLSEGAAPTLSLTLMRSCGRDQGPSPHTCTFPHVASLLELLLLILWNPTTDVTLGNPSGTPALCSSGKVQHAFLWNF